MIGDLDKEKYLEALRSLLDENLGANNQHLGKAKLMKLLYSITGDTYVELDYYADLDHYAKHGR